MSNPLTERNNSLALHLGDVLTGIADFFAPSSSEQARQQDAEHCAEASADVPCASHKDAPA